MGVGWAIIPMKRVMIVEGRALGEIVLTRRNVLDKTKSRKKTSTKLMRIAELSRGDHGMEFRCLMPHFNLESLRECFHELDGKKAVGADGVTKEEYGQKLDDNLNDLLNRMKTLGYRPAPVRQVLIPKDEGTGGMRPLGISNFEDKIVQKMMSKILESIYEPIFHYNSFGFRPGRSCHTAIKELADYTFENWVESVVDVDLKNYFGTIDHGRLLEMLSYKIKDKTFLRYVSRMLKTGILTESGLMRTEEGTPQGSVVSPVLANIFAHYVIDEWFNNVVKKHSRRPVEMFRYCDDLVICCRYTSDAIRIRKALEGRCSKFSLELNHEKTKLVNFSKFDQGRGIKQGCFDFLGFTFYIGKTNSWKPLIKLKTSKKRMKSKLVKVKQWIRTNRHSGTLQELWDRFRIGLLGHIRYFGVSFNTRYVQVFVHKAVSIFHKWINRRSQRKSISWDKFYEFIRVNPLPKVQVYHSLLRGVR